MSLFYCNINLKVIKMKNHNLFVSSFSIDIIVRTFRLNIYINIENIFYKKLSKMLYVGQENNKLYKMYLFFFFILFLS